MKRIILSLALPALLLAPNLTLASTPKPAPDKAVALQAQINALKQQMADLQKQVGTLQAQHGQSLCISLWCA